MKKLVSKRIWLGTFSVCLLALLNIISVANWPWGKIVSLLVLIAAIVVLAFSIKNNSIAASLNKWGYELEFFIVLIAGLFTKSRFTTYQMLILVLAVILFLISWLLKFRQYTESDD